MKKPPKIFLALNGLTSLAEIDPAYIAHFTQPLHPRTRVIRYGLFRVSPRQRNAIMIKRGVNSERFFMRYPSGKERYVCFDSFCLFFHPLPDLMRELLTTRYPVACTLDRYEMKKNYAHVQIVDLGATSNA